MIFKQIINLVNRVDMQELINRHNSYYYYKAFKTRTRLFTHLSGIMSRCDSTKIRLFSDIFKGVGHYPKRDGKKKGGLKVHMLIDTV